MCKVYSNIECVGSWNFKTQIFHRYEKTCLVHSSSRKSERMIKYLVYSMHAMRLKEYSISLKKKYGDAREIINRKIEKWRTLQWAKKWTNRHTMIYNTHTHTHTHTHFRLNKWSPQIVQWTSVFLNGLLMLVDWDISSSNMM